MRGLMLLISMLFMAVGTCTADAQVAGIEVVDRGIYTIETGSETKDPNTPTGTITAVKDVKNVELTTTIPARLGIEFGFQYIVVGEPAGAEVTLDIVNIYPEQGLPTPGSTEHLFRSEYSRTKKIGEIEYLGYGFENAWEVVPGNWTFQIWYDGRQMMEQSFTVTE